MNYPSVEELLIIHSEIIDHTGGSHGVRDLVLLASSAERAKARYGGQDLYKSVFEKAGTYLHSLAMHHVFIDGNKRTSIAVAAYFLDMNGYTLKVSNKEMEKFVLNVVVARLEIPAIAKWFERHTAPASRTSRRVKK